MGRKERHDVLIEKVRKTVVGGLLPQECRAYVDGQLAGVFTNSRAGARRERGLSDRAADRAVVTPKVTGRTAPGPIPS